MPKIALLFPGQGAQFVGMGLALYQEFTAAREIFEEAEDVLGKNLRKLCFEGSLAELNKLENMFPAIVTTGYATFNVYMREVGIEPDFVAGHSLGEYVALACSGVISFSAALKLAGERAELALDSNYTENGTMTVINQIDSYEVEQACERMSVPGCLVVVACYNSPDQTVVAGHHHAVMKLEDMVSDKGAQIAPILMSPPFHSPLMEKASVALGEKLRCCAYQPFRWPVISNYTGLPYEFAAEKITEGLMRQMVRPVQWQKTMKYLKTHGITTVIEMGTQAILTNLLKTNEKALRLIAYGQNKNWQVKPGSEDAPEKRTAPTVLTKCLAAASATRNRNRDLEEYRQGVEQPYERMEAMQDELDKNGNPPGDQQMREALAILGGIFATKKVPAAEQRKWFEKILGETGTRDQYRDFLGPFLARPDDE